ncbi:MAG: PAAR domain-containing protein [Myxococcales bacterium]|nr:PAAR domain-containing protein [Myxococcales bacterium]
MTAAARVNDYQQCVIQWHMTGPIVAGSATVLIGYQPAARVGDPAACIGPCAIVTGEPTVLIESFPAARLGDMTSHGGVIISGCIDVLIGMSAQASVLVAAASRGAPFCEECEGA